MDTGAFIATIEAARKALPRGDHEAAMALLQQCREAERLITKQRKKLDRRVYRSVRPEYAGLGGVTDPLARELIDIGYKALAKELHPDRGGSVESMAMLNRVRDRMRAATVT